MKTAELIGPALDWAVAKIEGHDVYIPAFASQPWLQIRGEHGFVYRCPKYTTDWVHGGPIIEREKIGVNPEYLPCSGWVSDTKTISEKTHQHGPTPLVAAMRCYVASKLGDEVEIPDALK